MEVTEVRVRMVERKRDRLRAFCSVTFDNAFVIRDVKVIRGDQGLFVAMPSRKLTDRCPSCRTKNQFRARYCGECGTKLADNRAEVDERGRPRLYVDVAHPINAEAREGIEQAVLAAYREEEERAKQPDYRPAPLYEEEAEEPEEFEEPAREDEQPAQPAAPEPPVTSAPEPPRRSTPKPPPTSPPKKPGEAGRRFGEGIFDGEEPEGPAEQ